MVAGKHKAFAVCNGNLLILQHEGDDNIVLKPSVDMRL